MHRSCFLWQSAVLLSPEVSSRSQVPDLPSRLLCSPVILNNPNLFLQVFPPTLQAMFSSSSFHWQWAR